LLVWGLRKNVLEESIIAQGCSLVLLEKRGLNDHMLGHFLGEKTYRQLQLFRGEEIAHLEGGKTFCGKSPIDRDAAGLD